MTSRSSPFASRATLDPEDRGADHAGIVEAASAPAAAGPSQVVVHDTSYRLVSDFGPDTLLIRELLFPQAVRVDLRGSSS